MTLRSPRATRTDTLVPNTTLFRSVIGAVHFDTCVRYIKENPWNRLRTLRDGFAATRRQVIIRSKCALRFELEPDDISRLWVERLIANGVQRIVGFDGLHDIDNLEDSQIGRAHV